ncbi:MAG: CHAP domain-containing protein, partial [Nonomuraea sp.]|nr:CHAP domain-containing protein [Nonomuraea sp.]
MAKHAMMKTDLAKLALGATIAATALGATVAVNADSTHHTTAASQQAAGSKVNVTAAQVLATAKAQVGTSENDNGGGTKFQQWYASSPRAAETVARDGGSRQDYLNAAWCSMFVSWVG